MQLSSGEKPIVAYFPTSNAAHQAAKSLQNAGFVTVRVDEISDFDAGSDPHYDNPVDTSLNDMQPTVHSYKIGETLTGAERLINITNPSANDYINSDYEATLMLTTTEDKKNQATEIIKENGGNII